MSVLHAVVGRGYRSDAASADVGLFIRDASQPVSQLEHGRTQRRPSPQTGCVTRRKESCTPDNNAHRRLPFTVGSHATNSSLDLNLTRPEMLMWTDQYRCLRPASFRVQRRPQVGCLSRAVTCTLRSETALWRGKIFSEVNEIWWDKNFDVSTRILQT